MPPKLGSFTFRSWLSVVAYRLGRNSANLGDVIVIRILRSLKSHAKVEYFKKTAFKVVPNFLDKLNHIEANLS